METRYADNTAPQQTDEEKPQALSRLGLCVIDAIGKIDQLARVPTTSTSTRRFLARPSRVALSATGWVKPLPSV